MTHDRYVGGSGSEMREGGREGGRLQHSVHTIKAKLGIAYGRLSIIWG